MRGYLYQVKIIDDVLEIDIDIQLFIAVLERKKHRVRFLLKLVFMLGKVNRKEKSLYNFRKLHYDYSISPLITELHIIQMCRFLLLKREMDDGDKDKAEFFL